MTPCPGSKLVCWMVRLGAAPCKACERLGAARPSRGRERMTSTPPERLTFFCVPYPTTTTSPRDLSSKANEMVSSALETATLFYFVAYIREAERPFQPGKFHLKIAGIVGDRMQAAALPVHGDTRHRVSFFVQDLAFDGHRGIPDTTG